jgi:hypothetical protein
MRIILKHGKDVENGNKEDIADIAVGEVVYDRVKKALYTHDGEGKMIQLCEVFAAPDGALYTRLPQSKPNLIPLYVERRL